MKTQRKPPLFPFRAVDRYIDSRWLTARFGQGCDTATLSNDERAELLGVDRDQVTAWRRTGVPLWRAEALAIGLGRHPDELWPDWSVRLDEWLAGLSRRTRREKGLDDDATVDDEAA